MSTKVDAKDILIPIEDLPAEAYNFIRQHFYNHDICFATKNINVATKITKPIETEYTVRLTDDTVLEFDRKGNWKEIEGVRNEIPPYLPEYAKDYLGKYYSDISIVQIERIGKKYDIKFNNGKEVIIADKGEVKEIMK